MVTNQPVTRGPAGPPGPPGPSLTPTIAAINFNGEINFKEGQLEKVEILGAGERLFIFSEPAPNQWTVIATPENGVLVTSTVINNTETLIKIFKAATGEAANSGFTAFCQPI